MAGLEYTFRRPEEGDVDGISNLIYSAFQVRRSRDLLIWKYKRNPAGRDTGCIAVIGDDVIAIAGGIPQMMKVGDEEVKVCSTGDAIVKEEFRSAGLYLKVARIGIRNTIDSGCVFFLGGANELSTRVQYILGFRSVAQISYLTFPLDVTPLVTRRLRFKPLAKLIAAAINLAFRIYCFRIRRGRKNLVVKEVQRFDDRFNRLWDRVKGFYRITCVRNTTFLNWRYVECPIKHTVFAAEDKKSGEILGYVALKIDKEDEKKVGLLMDCFCAPEDRAALDVLLDRAILHFRQNRCHIMRSWGFEGLNLFKHLMRRRFFDRKSPFFFIVKPGEGNEEVVLDIRNWYILQGDTDHVGSTE